MDKFSASEQSLGYHYQIRYSLYLLLGEKDKAEAYITLEKLDDIEVGDIDRQNLVQTKLHGKTVANLSDKSPDLWKTLRVWSESILTGEIDLENTLFILVTTAKVAPNSIASEFTKEKTEYKTIQATVEALDKISSDSKNKDLKSSFDAYNKLAANQKRNLVERMFINDNSLSIDDLKEKIKFGLRFFLLPNQLESAFSDLQGWWYERCLQHLLGKAEKISLAELLEKTREISNKYRDDTLPIDKLIKDSQPDEEDYDTRNFVKQLKLVNAGKNSIGVAIRDYYRAFEQRSKWLREKLLNPQEEIDYDKDLKDDWKARFAFIEDDYDETEETACIEVSKNFYKEFYANSHPQLFIRPSVRESFIVRGSCQILSDKKEIGWHPKYKELLDKGLSE